MNPSTNAAKRRFPPYQSPDGVISSDRQSHDESETAFSSRKGTWHWNVQTDTTVWSEQLYGIVGRENATIPPFKEHCRFHTSESWIRLVDATLELLQNRTPYELRLQMLHADGTRKWVIRHGEAVCNEHGDILQLRGTVQDVSDSMRHAGKADRDWHTRSGDEDAASRLIQAHEQENAKRASELRDSVCQRIALLAVKIQTLSSSVPNLSPEAQTQFDSLWEETKAILAELHSVSDRLYPLVLDVLDLPLAIRSLCRDFTKEYGIPVEYSCSDLPALDKRSRVVLYRVLEEILKNVARHSSANNVTVGIDHDSAELRLRVSDNGIGFDQSKVKTATGLGFARMKAQIDQIGGSLAVWSEPGSGTLIETRTPLFVQRS